MTTNTLKKYDQCMAISVFYQRKVTLGNFIFLLSREFLTIFESLSFVVIEQHGLLLKELT